LIDLIFFFCLSSASSAPYEMMMPIDAIDAPTRQVTQKKNKIQ
jgi:hypothetical protein